MAKSFLQTDLINRFVCAVLGVISIIFAAILRVDDRSAFGTPLALAIFTGFYFIVALASSFFVWRREMCFCHKRAASFIIVGVAVAACCFATTGLALSNDSASGGLRILAKALGGMQLSSGLIEVVNIGQLAYNWYNISRSSGIKNNGYANVQV